jgi:hypothetical protein
MQGAHDQERLPSLRQGKFINFVIQSRKAELLKDNSANKAA